MTLKECVGKHTYREYRAWMEWLDRQYNKPSLTDWYIMQLTKVVTSFGMGKTKKAPDVGAFKLKFRIGPMSEAEKKTRVERSKSAWAAILGAGKPRKPLRKSDGR